MGGRKGHTLGQEVLTRPVVLLEERGVGEARSEGLDPLLVEDVDPEGVLKGDGEAGGCTCRW